MSKQLVWRDDDVSVNTTVDQLHRIHELFLKHGVTHTIAVICKNFIKNRDLIKYLNETPSYGIQIHCWEHVDITNFRLSDHYYAIESCLRVFKQAGFKEPTTIYPAWNKSTPLLEKSANKFGLVVSNDKMSLSGYLKGHTKQVINFHYWAPEMSDLEAALWKYKETIKI